MDQDWSVQYMVDGEEGEESCNTMLHDRQRIRRYVVSETWFRMRDDEAKYVDVTPPGD